MAEYDKIIHRQIARHSILRQILLWISNQVEMPTTSIQDYTRAPQGELVSIIQNIWKIFGLKKEYEYGFTEKVLVDPQKFVTELTWVVNN
jgi:hypothetical protein